MVSQVLFFFALLLITVSFLGMLFSPTLGRSLLYGGGLFTGILFLEVLQGNLHLAFFTFFLLVTSLTHLLQRDSKDKELLFQRFLPFPWVSPFLLVLALLLSALYLQSALEGTLRKSFEKGGVEYLLLGEMIFALGLLFWLSTSLKKGEGK